ncbi:MAG: hypothetical protein JWL61_2626 [Gemmatimonadetes bacterium]|nr:hypothetical protein [Gemmatimonadota bacterium]
MKSRALRAVLLCGLVYLVAGVVLGALAGRAGSIQERNIWRWAAWVISAIAFGLHIVYEQVKVGSSARLTALRVSLAVGIGAFGLAAAANVHAQSVSPTKHSVLLLLSLIIWPVMTALPAFVVALIAAAILARLRSVQS